MSAPEDPVADTTEQTDENTESTFRDGSASDRSTVRDAARSGLSLSELDEEELTTLVEELRAENRRLRGEYAQAHQSEYKRSALVLFALGVLGVASGLLFPVAREILFILGAVGLFGGVLTWYLTPERLVTATVGQSIYESVANTGSNLRNELGLETTNVYVPVDDIDVSGAPVKLFVPQSSQYELPEGDDLTSLFVLPESTERRGVAVRPTAARLVREFQQSTVEPVANEPEPLVSQLVDSLVEQFEIVDNVDTEFETDDTESPQVTVSIRGGVYDEEDGFDHPVASFFGTGLAVGLDRAVSVEVTVGDDQTNITCQW